MWRHLKAQLEKALFANFSKACQHHFNANAVANSEKAANHQSFGIHFSV